MSAPLAIWNTKEKQKVYLQPTAAHSIQDRRIMDDSVLYASIHCSQDQVTVRCGSKMGGQQQKKTTQKLITEKQTE